MLNIKLNNKSNEKFSICVDAVEMVTLLQHVNKIMSDLDHIYICCGFSLHQLR